MLKNLRRRYARFMLRNRDKGIPNLMLYIALGNAVVTIIGMIYGGDILYNLLCFDKTKILQGEVWRLLTYVFTMTYGDIFALIFMYFFYMLGRQIEYSMGTLRFNLFYFSGILMMDAFAMIFCPFAYEGMLVRQEQWDFLQAVLSSYNSMALYMHLSLLLMYATTNPESRFLFMFFIPVPAWLMALLYLVIVTLQVVSLSYPILYFPHNLFPLVAIGNYLLFTGRNIVNVLPLTLRAKVVRLFQKKQRKQKQAKVVQFRQGKATAGKGDFNHRCEICGRTDVSNPELEFRYCSRCTGYRCYCEDHINDHTHE